MKHEPQRDPVPPFAREVLDLFAEALTDVRFPDLDHGVLEAAAEELRAAQCQVEQIEQQLQAARTRVLEKTDALMERAQRALAYARVYASADDALSAHVERVGQGQLAGAAPQAKRKPKVRKAQHEADLFPADDAGVGLDALPM